MKSESSLMAAKKSRLANASKIKGAIGYIETLPGWIGTALDRCLVGRPSSRRRSMFNYL
jgi:hypothetical protein